MSRNLLRLFRIYFTPKMLLMLVLGFSSGIPLALTGSTLSAWLVAEGVDIRTIGIFSLVGLPYAFKFIWSPFMDRFIPPFLGRRRGWMMMTQLALIAAISALGFFNPSSMLVLAAATALVLAFLSASQDIVLDAYRDGIPEARGAGAPAAGIWIMGYRIAILVSSSVALILSDFLSWRTVYVIMGTTMAIGCVATLLAPEPTQAMPGAEAIEPPQTIRDAVILPFVDFFRRPGAIDILLFIILYKIGEVAASQMTTPFILKHIGFSRTELGTIYKGFGMAATIAGTLLGGAVMSRWSLKRALFVFGLFQGAATLVFILLGIHRPRALGTLRRDRHGEHLHRHGNGGLRGPAHGPVQSEIHGHPVRAAEQPDGRKSLRDRHADGLHGRMVGLDGLLHRLYPGRPSRASAFDAL